MVHHDRSRLKKELEKAESEWKLLNKHAAAINKVGTVARKYFYVLPRRLSEKVNV